MIFLDYGYNSRGEWLRFLCSMTAIQKFVKDWSLFGISVIKFGST